MEWIEFTTTEFGLLLAFGVLFIIQILFFFIVYNKLWMYNKSTKNREYTDDKVPLSVIICAHDQVDLLRENLPRILEQDYPDFEVIVINDGSKDETETVLGALEEKYSNLYHSFVPDSSRYISHKKLALTLGIKASRYDWLVFTEPECVPMSSKWLQLMARNFTRQTDFVLGYSGYLTKSESWFKRKVVYDNLFTAMRYMGMAILGRPYMGIGRNMAYRKKVFYESKGFSTHLNLRRGEDDLFVNETASGRNTRVETHADACVQITQRMNPFLWKEEKVNRAVTSHFYKGGQLGLWKLETLSRFLFVVFVCVGCVVTLLNQHFLATGLFIVVALLRYVLWALVVNKTAKSVCGVDRYYFSLWILDAWRYLVNARFKLMARLAHKSDFLRK